MSKPRVKIIIFHDDMEIETADKHFYVELQRFWNDPERAAREILENLGFEVKVRKGKEK